MRRTRRRDQTREAPSGSALSPAQPQAPAVVLLARQAEGEVRAGAVCSACGWWGSARGVRSPISRGGPVWPIRGTVPPQLTSASVSAHLESVGVEHQGARVADAPLARGSETVVLVPTVAGRWDPRVLVVDDDEISRGAAVGLLQALGLTVDVAAGGQEAIEMTAQRPYAAIFMDCQMPEVDGYMAVRRLRRGEANSRTPVIAVTSRPRWVSLASGMDHHLAKPLEIDGLRADCRWLGLLGPAGGHPGGRAEILGGDVPLLDPSIFGVLAADRRVPTARPAARFIEDATARLPELWRAANAGNCASMQTLALALQRHAAHVGAARISVLCEHLSEAAAGLAIAAAAGIEVQLRRALGDTHAAIRAYVEGTISAMPAPTVDPRNSQLADVSAAAPGALVRVALADDDPLARVATAAMLEGAEWIEVVGVATGVEEIVVLAADKRPDVIVLDWMMPGGGGRAAARRILDDSPGTLIVALTSSDSLEALTEMISAGAACLVAKGGSADQLVQTIARTLKTFAATRAAEEEARSARRGMGGGMRLDDTPRSESPLDPGGVERLQTEFGSSGILGELVELFGSQTPGRLISMRTAIEAGDAGAVSGDAHQLKGGCLTLAANHMAELCDKLEMSAGGGSLEGAAALVDQIEGAFEQAYAALLRAVT